MRRTRSSSVSAVDITTPIADPARRQELKSTRARRRQDELPAIKPIPMQSLDEEDEELEVPTCPKLPKIEVTTTRKEPVVSSKEISTPSKKVNPGTQDPPKKVLSHITETPKKPQKEPFPHRKLDPIFNAQHLAACKLDLVVVYRMFKSEHYINRVPGLLKVNRKPRLRTKPTNGRKIIVHEDPTGNGEETSSKLTRNLQDTKYITDMWRDVKVKLHAYFKMNPVSFKKDEQRVEMKRSQQVAKSAYLKAFTGKRPSDDPESFPWRGLGKLMQFALDTHVSWDELCEAYTRWDSYRKCDESTTNITELQIANYFGISENAVKDFDFYKDPAALFTRIRKRTFHSFLPDLMKQLAFSCYLKNEDDKCVYYLAEAQGAMLKQDVIDKHAVYFSKLEEYGRSLAPTEADEKVRKTLFRLQLTDLRRFGSTLEMFPTYTESINPKWHIVQLSSVFHSQKRYSSAIGSPSKAPAIFISTLTTINGNKKRFASTFFVDEPKLDPGVTKLNIAQLYEDLMADNRKINENATREGKKRYWEIRGEHNERMRGLVGNLENDWIAPWNFLFPGNVLDDVTIKEITHAIEIIKKQIYPEEFPERMTGVLYKLIENYNCLDPQTQTNLHVLLEEILRVPADIRSRLCAKVVRHFGERIIFLQPRSPTILVLDQDLEQYPWECMNCLKDTDVTRVPFISMIYSLIRINHHPVLQMSREISTENCVYVINPDGSLLNVEARLIDYFKNRTGWSGYANQKPSALDFEVFVGEKDLFVYCGHGNGNQILPEGVLHRAACRAVPLLMGCASVKNTIICPQSFGSSVVNSYLTATCRSVVGFLWEITDMECDRITADLIERFAPSLKAPLPQCFRRDDTPIPYHPSIPRCVRLSRDAATQFMTQSALVNYGIPVQAKFQPLAIRKLV